MQKKMQKKCINTWWIPIFICNFNKSIETAEYCISIFHKMTTKIYTVKYNNYARKKKRRQNLRRY
jgi:hypothetical protein